MTIELNRKNTVVPQKIFSVFIASFPSCYQTLIRNLCAAAFFFFLIFTCPSVVFAIPDGLGNDILPDNVGIGTSFPWATLQVDGAVYGGLVMPSHNEVDMATSGNAMFGRNVEIDGALYVDSGIYFTGSLVGDGSRLTGITGSSTIIQDVDTYIYVIDGDRSRLGFTVNGSTSMIMDQNGNTGIGTTTPRARLEVSGNVYVMSGKVGVGVITPASTLDVEGSVAIGATYSGTSAAPLNGLIVQGNVGMGTSSPAAGLHVGTGAASMTGAVLGATGALVRGAMEVDGTLYANSNVGIGTTLPAAKLNVVGGSVVVKELDLVYNAALTVDWSQSNQQDVTLTGNSTITFTNYLLGQTMRLVVCQGGAGAFTVVWDASVVWAGGAPPVLSTAAGICDVVSFIGTGAKGGTKAFASITKYF